MTISSQLEFRSARCVGGRAYRITSARLAIHTMDAGFLLLQPMAESRVSVLLNGAVSPW
jgi:hypothetical protein